MIMAADNAMVAFLFIWISLLVFECGFIIDASEWPPIVAVGGPTATDR